MKILDQDRIYVENVRAFYDLTTNEAKALCELAVQHGFYEKRFGIACPGCNRIVMSVSSILEIPERVDCDICEAIERDYSFLRKDVSAIEFYRLGRNTDRAEADHFLDELKKRIGK